jgi:transcriptional regulator with XRE-family HTH domain
MPIQALTGTRLRERRISLGLRQAEVALASGISPSYLNLIEHNRRRISPELLARLAASLSVQVSLLEEGSGGALVEELRAAAADSVGQGVEIERVEDFAGRFPGWAGLLGGLHQRGRGLARAVEALNDRLSHDPHLSAALHDVLSMVSSVRSTAAILAETPDIEPEWRERFLHNLNTDSARLASRVLGLVAFLDGSEATDASLIVAPQEEVEAWLGRREWSLGAPEDMAREISDLASPSARVLAATFLTRAAQDARALPQAEFAAAVAEIGLDPARLAQRFGTGLLPVFRRLPIVGAPEAGLVLCDASGTVTLQKPTPGFSLPRFGAACPLWPLFTALSRPMTPIDAMVETPANRRFRILAYAEARHPDGFSGPELREAAMLILPPTAAQSATPLIRLGSTCRICPRANCPARREPSILSVVE